MLERKVLDKGVVKLAGFTVDLEDLAPAGMDDHLPVMEYRLDLSRGLESQIVRAARASYTGGTKNVREDTALIDYLIRHGHWSPFEMVQFKFFIKAPLFVVQQFLRHRTFSFNQESARYSVLEEEYYLPEHFRKQSAKNKQGSEGVLDSEELFAEYQHAVEQAFAAYHRLLEAGVAREMARMVLPVSTYTKLYVRGDLRNWLHFLELRMDDHAQQEIRQYAEAIHSLLYRFVPNVMASWDVHVRRAIRFNPYEAKLVSKTIDSGYLPLALEEASEQEKQGLPIKFKEFTDKLWRLLTV